MVVEGEVDVDSAVVNCVVLDGSASITFIVKFEFGIKFSILESTSSVFKTIFCISLIV